MAALVVCFYGNSAAVIAMTTVFLRASGIHLLRIQEFNQLGGCLGPL